MDSMLPSEKSKKKIIKDYINGISKNQMIDDFMNKVYSNEIQVGNIILTVDEAKNWCLNKNIILDNDFAYFITYWVSSYNSKNVGQGIIGNWFGETKTLGDNIKGYIRDYVYPGLKKKGNK